MFRLVLSSHPQFFQYSQNSLSFPKQSFLDRESECFSIPNKLETWAGHNGERVKVKASQFISLGVWSSDIKTPLIFNLWTSQRWLLNFTNRPLRWGNRSPRFPLIRRLGWFQGPFQLIVEEINLMFLPETEQHFLRRRSAGHCDYDTMVPL